MIKRIFLLVIIAGFITACSNNGTKEISAKTEGSESGLKVEFASLIANPESYVGKTILVEGKVVHVCTETGKKMFIVGDNPDVRLYVAAGESISKFPMELLGSVISVEGLITKTGGTTLAANVEPGKEMGGNHTGEGHGDKMASDSCETEKALEGQPSMANIIMEYKSHTIK